MRSDKLRDKAAFTRESEQGFTLTEMMIVMALIAMIATFAIRKLMSTYTEGQVNATKIQMRQLMTILDDYRRQCNQYPTTDQGLDALAHPPATCKNANPDGLIKNVPKDGWDNDFVYESDGAKFTIKSFGADRKEGGEGFNKDILSNELD